MQGLVLPPIFTVVVAYIGEEWPPAEATGVTGLYMSATSIGGFCGRFFSGVLADTVGWRNGFLVARRRDCSPAVSRSRPSCRASAISCARRALPPPRGRCSRHLRNPRLLAIYAVGFGTLFNFVALFTYVGFVLAAPPFNLSPTLLGAIFVTYLVGAVGGALARPRRRALRTAHARHRRDRRLDVRRAAHARAVAVGDHRRSCDRGGMRFRHPGDLDRLGRADRRERPHLGDRALCDVLLYRRRRRRDRCPDWPGTRAVGPAASRW